MAISKRDKKACPVVHVEFMDHAMGTSDEVKPIKCEVFGVLYKETPEAYYVASWICGSDPFNHNSETFCIIKHKSTKLRRL